MGQSSIWTSHFYLKIINETVPALVASDLVFVKLCFDKSVDDVQPV